MKILNKIKFIHVVLIIALYMGINIGIKYYKIYELINSSKEPSNEVLIDTYEFDGKTFEFYYDESNPYGEVATKLNGVEMPINRGFSNKENTKHIYIQSYDDAAIYQDGIKLEPIKTIGSNKVRNVYIYELDLNTDIRKRNEKISKDLNIVSSFVDGSLTLDMDELRTIVNSWKKITSESFKRDYENHNVLYIENTWDFYNADIVDFESGERAEFQLLRNERIIIEVFHRTDSNSYGNSYYELTQKQYDEFVNLIKNQ